MSRPPTELSSSVTLMNYKLPVPLKIALGAGTPMWMIPAVSAIFQTKQYDVAALCACLGGALLFLIYTNNSGYRIAWDNERLYMRDWGFQNLLFQRKPFSGIAFDDMRRIEGRFQNNPRAMSRFVPYEFLEITSKKRADNPIWIYPLSLKQDELAELLVHLYDKRRDIFPEQLIQLMRADSLISN